jgi:vacuole morphology and inheritance protein 14
MLLGIFADMHASLERRLTAITWLQEFVELGRDKMMPYAASVLGAILPCLSHSEERVALVALRYAVLHPCPPSCLVACSLTPVPCSTNDALLALHPTAGDGFDLKAVLAVLEQEVSEGKEPTRLAALRQVWLCGVRFQQHALTRPALPDGSRCCLSVRAARC